MLKKLTKNEVLDEKMKEKILGGTTSCQERCASACSPTLLNKRLGGDKSSSGYKDPDPI